MIKRAKSERKNLGEKEIQLDKRTSREKQRLALEIAIDCGLEIMKLKMRDSN